MRIGYRQVKDVVGDVLEEKTAARTKEFLTKGLGEASLMDLLGGEK